VIKECKVFASKHILSSAILWVGHGAREGEQPPPLVIAFKISRIEFIEKWGLTPVLKPRQDQRPRRAGAEDPGDGRYISPFIPYNVHPAGSPTQPLVLHVTHLMSCQQRGDLPKHAYCPSFYSQVRRARLPGASLLSYYGRYKLWSVYSLGSFVPEQLFLTLLLGKWLSFNITPYMYFIISLFSTHIPHVCPVTQYKLQRISCLYRLKKF
jgi:hypothetical protein